MHVGTCGLRFGACTVLPQFCKILEAHPLLLLWLGWLFLYVSSICILTRRACAHAQLLDAFRSANSVPDRDVQMGALRVCAKSGDWKSAMRIWEKLPSSAAASPGQPSSPAAADASAAGSGQAGSPAAQLQRTRAMGAKLVLDACQAADQGAKAAELTERFKGMGLSL